MLKRREAREILVGLLFESEFRTDENYVEIYALSAEERMIPEDEYIKKAYYAIFEHKDEIDACIGEHAHGWKTSRMTRLSRSILRLAVYEMLFEKEIPYSVSINEAIELAKRYEGDRAPAFVNGILNAVAKSVGGAEA